MCLYKHHCCVQIDIDAGSYSVSTTESIQAALFYDQTVIKCSIPENSVVININQGGVRSIDIKVFKVELCTECSCDAQTCAKVVSVKKYTQ